MRRTLNFTRGLRWALVVSLGAMTVGCAEVKPWEKGVLAKPEMTFEGDVLDTKFSEHIYSSKEAASGSSGVGGGGCGCN
jgi:hypothetical protein